MGKSSAFRGVTLFRPTGKWRAQVSERRAGRMQAVAPAARRLRGSLPPARRALPRRRRFVRRRDARAPAGCPRRGGIAGQGRGPNDGPERDARPRARSSGSPAADGFVFRPPWPPPIANVATRRASGSPSGGPRRPRAPLPPGGACFSSHTPGVSSPRRIPGQGAGYLLAWATHPARRGGGGGPRPGDLTASDGSVSSVRGSRVALVTNFAARAKYPPPRSIPAPAPPRRAGPLQRASVP